MSFDITVLGSSGGPLEGVTCSYILKPSYISYHEIIQESLNQYLIAIDAGSGLNRITEIIQTERLTSKEEILAMKLLNYYNDPLPITEYSHPSISIAHHYNVCKFTNESSIELSFKIYDLINNFLISHPHLDHINGLVINSAGLSHNSSKLIYGLKETTDALERHIFNGIIWPNLLSERNGALIKLIEITPQIPLQLNQVFEMIPFELNHGKKQDNKTQYKSTSFLIKDLTTDKQILIFGDLEGDKNSSNPKNHLIWSKVSDLIIRRTLKTLLIECSTPNLPAEEPRYGHLTPDALFEELTSLGDIITRKQGTDEPPLKDMNILITHVKERRSGNEPRRIILNELNELNEKYKLGCHFTILLSGLTYTV